jgi:hypothetical protein
MEPSRDLKFASRNRVGVRVPSGHPLTVLTDRRAATSLGDTTQQKYRGPLDESQLQLARQELRAPVAKAPVSVGVGYD